MATITVSEAKRKRKRRFERLMDDVGKGDTASREELEAMVIQKAASRAARNGTSAQLEESYLWRSIYSRRLPEFDSDGNILKSEMPGYAPTKAETQIEELALSIQKRAGGSYGAAYIAALDARPELYSQFLEQADEIAKARKAKDDSDPGTTMTSGKGGQRNNDGSTMRLRARPQDEEDDEEDDGLLDDEDDQDDEDGRDREKRRKRVAKADLSAVHCPSCSELNSADSNYCKQCGKAF